MPPLLENPGYATRDGYNGASVKFEFGTTSNLVTNNQEFLSFSKYVSMIREMDAELRNEEESRTQGNIPDRRHKK